MFYISLCSTYIEPLIDNHIVYKITEQLLIWSLLIISIFLINKKAKWMVGK